ncbi:hypothetical protein DDQ68_05870 [Hymenobacter nivis]|uniref:Uncharacterized protein n=1 Tax=Hymenobacter nivis TaxID=1850093 RepID=A0A2Z3GJZ8_9BACT|nr:hypothetical protein DDQ68_05870 [Hymenobacter nivis]
MVAKPTGPGAGPGGRCYGGPRGALLIYSPVRRPFQPADWLTVIYLLSLTTIGRPAEKAGGPAAASLYTDLKMRWLKVKIKEIKVSPTVF